MKPNIRWEGLFYKKRKFVRAKKHDFGLTLAQVSDR